MNEVPSRFEDVEGVQTTTNIGNLLEHVFLNDRYFIECHKLKGVAILQTEEHLDDEGTEGEFDQFLFFYRFFYV